MQTFIKNNIHYEVFNSWECLSHRPCKDCDLRFSLQYVKEHFFGVLLLSKQVGGQARLHNNTHKKVWFYFIYFFLVRNESI